MASIKNTENAYKILSEYRGKNPYIYMLKKEVIINSKKEALGDFQIEYILSNYNKEPQNIGKIIKIADWYGEKKKEDWGVDFIPQKLLIVSLIGETKTTYNCYVQYRQSVPPVMAFIPKKAVLTNFLVEDFSKLNIDFDRYDRLSMEKDNNRKLFPHQKEAIKFLLSRKKCILADDQGLGKTTSLAVAAIEGNFDSIVIICPASLKSNWKKELMWYIPEKDISIIESFNDKNKTELEAFLGYKEGTSNKTREELIEEAKIVGKWQSNHFIIINYDILADFYKLPNGRSQKSIEEAYNQSPLLQYIKNRKSLIIIDEAHKLSNSTSIRYKVIMDLIKRGNPDSIYAATGTPITNNPYNFYCVLNLLGDPITDDYKYFVERYCSAFQIPAKGEKEKWTNIYLSRIKKRDIKTLSIKEQYGLKDFIRKNARMILVPNGDSNLEELKERTSHIYLRRVKEDLKGITNKTIHEIYYNLTTEQQNEYNKLWSEYEEAQKENNPDKELNKDLLEGGLYRKYLSTQMVPHTIKLVDKFIENGEKVVIACCYDDELYKLKENYGDSCVIYNGKITSKIKDKNKEDFINNPNKKVFIGNITAAGVGLTLTVATKLVFNTFSYVTGDNSQMMDRIHRIGQNKDVDIYFQIFNNTQYQKMWDIVMRKSMIINAVIKKEDEK